MSSRGLPDESVRTTLGLGPTGVVMPFLNSSLRHEAGTTLFLETSRSA